MIRRCDGDRVDAFVLEELANIDVGLGLRDAHLVHVREAFCAYTLVNVANGRDFDIREFRIILEMVGPASAHAAEGDSHTFICAQDALRPGHQWPLRRERPSHRAGKFPVCLARVSLLFDSIPNRMPVASVASEASRDAFRLSERSRGNRSRAVRSSYQPRERAIQVVHVATFDSPSSAIWLFDAFPASAFSRSSGFAVLSCVLMLFLDERAWIRHKIADIAAVCRNQVRRQSPDEFLRSVRLPQTSTADDRPGRGR